MSLPSPDDHEERVLQYLSIGTINGVEAGRTLASLMEINWSCIVKGCTEENKSSDPLTCM
jgi:hypothetical protein